MSISETVEKIKPFYTPILIALVAITFFFLGKMSAEESQKTAVNINYPNINQTATALNSSSTQNTENIIEPIQQDGPVIGSKSGKKYYFPWCGTVKRIKPENQVKFGSIAEAKNAGFTAGGNCKGLW